VRHNLDPESLGNPFYQTITEDNLSETFMSKLQKTDIFFRKKILKEGRDHVEINHDQQKMKCFVHKSALKSFMNML